MTQYRRQCSSNEALGLAGQLAEHNQVYCIHCVNCRFFSCPAYLAPCLLYMLPERVSRFWVVYEPELCATQLRRPSTVVMTQMLDQAQLDLLTRKTVSQPSATCCIACCWCLYPFEAARHDFVMTQPAADCYFVLAQHLKPSPWSRIPHQFQQQMLLQATWSQGGLACVLVSALK